MVTVGPRSSPAKKWHGNGTDSWGRGVANAMATKAKYGKPIRRVQVFTVSQVARLEGVSE